jgi:hypothetical protein
MIREIDAGPETDLKSYCSIVLLYSTMIRMMALRQRHNMHRPRHRQAPQHPRLKIEHHDAYTLNGFSTPSAWGCASNMSLRRHCGSNTAMFYKTRMGVCSSSPGSRTSLSSLKMTESLSQESRRGIGHGRTVLRLQAASTGNA